MPRPGRSIALLAIMASALLLSACDGELDSLAGIARSQAGQRLELAQRSVEAVTNRLRGERRARRDRGGRRLGRSADLLPHQADYVVQVSGYRTGRFTEASGTLTIDLIDSCGDWTLQEKLDVVLRDQAKTTYRSNLLYRATETASTNRFTFAYSRDHLNVREDFIGDAIPIDGGVLATFIEPKTADLVLPDDVVFPITHLRQILAAARRGRGRLEMIVFDGANDVAYRAVTTIGAALRANDSNPRVAEARRMLDRLKSDQLPRGRTWPVTMSFFPLDDAYAPPVLVRDLLLHESGVIVGLHFDYGDLQMDAGLRYLDIQEPFDACAAQDRGRDRRLRP